MTHVKAADLPAHDPSEADLAAIAAEDWHTVQGSLERLLVEAGLLALREQVIEAHTAPTVDPDLAPVAALPTRTARPPEGTAAA